MNEELELYKLLTDTDENGWNMIQELGWINDTEFCIWVSYPWIDELVKKLTEIFGYSLFDEGGFDAKMQSDCICIELCQVLEGYVDMATVFPKDKYQH